MKRKLLFVLFAFCGVGLSFAQNPKIEIFKWNDVFEEEFDPNLTGAKKTVFDEKVKEGVEGVTFRDVNKVAEVNGSGDDVWAVGDGRTPVYPEGSTAIGRWTSFAVEQNNETYLYFYVEVYKENPSNNGDGWNFENHDKQPAYAGDAVEIYVNDKSGRLQYGIGYRNNSTTIDWEEDKSKGKDYGSGFDGGRKDKVKIGMQTYTASDKLGADGDKKGWVLEALIPADTKGGCSMELAIAQEGSKSQRAAQINTFNSAQNNHENTAQYGTPTIGTATSATVDGTKKTFGNSDFHYIKINNGLGTPSYTSSSTDVNQNGSVGRWVAYELPNDEIYYYVEVFNPNPVNDRSENYWNADAVEIDVDNNGSAVQYGFGYYKNGYSTSQYNDSDVNKYSTKAKFAAQQRADNLGVDGKEKGYILEAIIPKPTDWNGKMELAINQSGGATARTALVNTFSTNGNNVGNSTDYAIVALGIPTPVVESQKVCGLCKDIDITFGEGGESLASEAVWSSEYAPVFEIVYGTGDAAASKLSAVVGTTNPNWCFDDAKTKGSAKWQMLLKKNEDGNNSLYVFSEITDNEMPVAEEGNWESDALEFYLKVNDGGTEKIDQFFIRYNEKTFTGHFGVYDKIANLEQKDYADGKWQLKFQIDETENYKFVFKDKEGNSVVSAEAALDMRKSGETCVYEQLCTWIYCDYNVFKDGRTDDERKKALARITPCVVAELENPELEWISDNPVSIIEKQNVEIAVKDNKNLAATYEWMQNGELLESATGEKFNLSELESGEYAYVVTATSSLGCKSVETEVLNVYVEKEIELPTAIDISANGISSGVNVLGAGAGEKLVVFNREGIKVYDEKVSKPEDMSGWNGCWDNKTSKPADPGIYFYVLERKGDKTYKGTVEVLNSDK